MPRVESVEEFLTLLKRSELLSHEQIVEMSDASNSLQNPRELADWLVKQLWLTRWQATQLLDGHEQLRVGKYRLLDLIGRGGMGLVFLAESTTDANSVAVPSATGGSGSGRPFDSQNRVALKVMTKLGNPKGMERYLQEVRAASTLDHPHIVQTLEAGVADGCHFMVMKFLPGLDLNAIMRDQSPLPVSWSCEVIRQTALGLQYAHEQGLVHRDIKPPNILVTPEPDFLTPHARILDFGLAHIAAESSSLREVTQTGAVLGTADYIAPEQAMSAKHADIRSDIFGLGCTLFQLITGELPFQGNNVMEKLMARITTTPPSVSALRAEAHSDLDDLVTNMLRTNPNDRPQTPAEVAIELDRLMLKIRRHESRIGKLSPRKLSPHAQSRSRLRRS
ncbi:MAG: serine/threonine protein kinase [Planctomycetaceae bacterium]|nr:serine/threonine protein kinase [Planctomycetaceae bacterium]